MPPYLSCTFLGLLVLCLPCRSDGISEAGGGSGGGGGGGGGGSKFFRRGGGIDVSEHSKRNRSILFYGRRTGGPDDEGEETHGNEGTAGIGEGGPTAHPSLTTVTPPRQRSFFRSRWRGEHDGGDAEGDGDDRRGVEEGEQGRRRPGEKPPLRVGVVLPLQIFQQRTYQKVIVRSLHAVSEERSRLDRKVSLLKKVRETFDFQWKPTAFNLLDDADSVNFGYLKVAPPPNDITNLLCDLGRNGSAAIVYFSNSEKFGRSTAASQYFIKMAGFLGVPVIAWNADNIGLEKETNTRTSDESASHLQLAPSLHHQVSALLSILRRYNWQHFGILTSEIAGHDDFVQAVRDRIAQGAEGEEEEYKGYVIQDVFVTKESSAWDLTELASSEVRIVLLYCTQAEAGPVMREARRRGLTSPQFMWLAAQSVVGDPQDFASSRRDLPVGMIGVHFDVKIESVLQDFVTTALSVFFRGIEAMTGESEQQGMSDPALRHSQDCQSSGRGSGWKKNAFGVEFYRHMKNVSMRSRRTGKVGHIFNDDGYVREAELTVLNLKPSGSGEEGDDGKWEEVGTWDSWSGLDIKDIVWPGQRHAPPEGVPDKFHMRITFLEEPPFVIVSDPDPVTAKCSINRGVPCWVHRDDDDEADGLTSHAGHNSSDAPGGDVDHRLSSKCCSGMCVDLLRKFEDDLKFTYELVAVRDAKFGTLENGRWNGLMAELAAKRTDMVLTAMKVNAQRHSAAGFTVPFLETGIAIVVAKRTGIISPTAFLEPFDFSSWMLVALVSIQASAFAIFIFEWLSPAGYNMTASYPSRSSSSQDLPGQEQHRFSLFRTYWLVWAILFQASVKVDCPRGFTARFMSFVWALFAVVFLSMYTANLAAFMIPRETYYDFSGIDDPRISNPMSTKPALRFATLPYSYSYVTLAEHHASVLSYMKSHNRYNSAQQAIRGLKNGSLDAFIYDGTVLNYLASQDEECSILQVGSWSAMTGYSLAFPKGSKHRDLFNTKILEMKENGDLERLGRFWMNGVCKPNEQEKRASKPLSISQFLSAFLLLGIGTAVSVALLLCEHFYMHYLVTQTKRGGIRDNGYLSLISTSLGKTRYLTNANSGPAPLVSESEANDAAVYENSTASSCGVADAVALASPSPSTVLLPHGRGTCRETLSALRRELDRARRQIRVLEGVLREHDGGGGGGNGREMGVATALRRRADPTGRETKL